MQGLDAGTVAGAPAANASATQQKGVQENGLCEIGRRAVHISFDEQTCWAQSSVAVQVNWKDARFVLICAAICNTM